MLVHPSKIYVKESPVHGLGVFAKEKIHQGEIFEECPVISLPIKSGEWSDILLYYRFNFPSGNTPTEQVMALGYGAIYNHSNTPNAYWFSEIEKRTLKFAANRDIETEEEIFVYYGDENYWKDGRFDVKIK